MKENGQKNMQQVWMMIEIDEIYQENYQIRMLRDNNVPGLLKVRGQGKNEKSLYRYDIRGKLPMEEGKEKKWNYEELREFIKQLVAVLYELNEYLLDINCLSLEPSRIYKKEEKYFFCYCPGFQKNIRDEFHTLAEYFVRETNYEDMQAVAFAAALHRASLDEQCDLEQIFDKLLKQKTKTPKEEVENKKEMVYSLEEDKILDDWAEEQETAGSFLREKKTVWDFVTERFQVGGKK